jgi:septal ring factor EnvC (AmiA/AmiB activator)
VALSGLFGGKIKKELEQTRQELDAAKLQLAETEKERDAYKKLIADTGKMSIVDLNRGIAKLQARKDTIAQEVEKLRSFYIEKKQAVEKQLRALARQAEQKKNELVVLDEEILLQSFGLYRPQYRLQDSQQYRERLDRVRDEQTVMVKSGTAASYPREFYFNDNLKQGERMIKEYTKLILRSFNNECDASMVNVKFSNVEAIEKKIRKAYETLNKLGHRIDIAVTQQYLDLKIEELRFYHEYQMKKQEEKEEQKRIRAELREQAALAKEIEEKRRQIEKERQHFSQALATINERLAQVQTEAERDALGQEKAKIEMELEEIEKAKLDVEMREQNTRAGHVYVISNIGSFGENVYKIGVTRRLEPEERVHELSDASVPFDFDTHALVFSEDAPALENALHKAFEDRKMNLVNPRREFFRVSLGEIEEVIRTNFGKPVELVRQPEAAQYRESLAIKQQQTEAASEPVSNEAGTETLPDLFDSSPSLGKLTP